MARKYLKPEMQGHIDGLCSIYSVLNACKHLFDHSEQSDERLFKAICISIGDLFPEIVYDGTELVGIKRILEAARVWCTRTHNRAVGWEQPFKLGGFEKSQDGVKQYFQVMNQKITARCIAVVGLEKPWGHWTCMYGATPSHAFFYDSWGFPRNTHHTAFTFEHDKAGDEDFPVLLNYHQTFLIHVGP